MCGRLQKKNAGLAELYRVYAFTRALPRLVGALQTMGEGSGNAELGAAVTERYLPKLTVYIEKFTKYQGLIEHVVDFSRLPDLEVNPKHDPELAEMREETDSMEEEVERYCLSRCRLCVTDTLNLTLYDLMIAGCWTMRAAGGPPSQM